MEKRKVTPLTFEKRSYVAPKVTLKQYTPHGALATLGSGDENQGEWDPQE